MALAALLLVVAVSALLPFVVFPQVEPLLPFTDAHRHSLTRPPSGRGAADQGDAEQVHGHRDGSVPHDRPRTR
jgi:hypothetical protein